MLRIQTFGRVALPRRDHHLTHMAPQGVPRKGEPLVF